MRAGPDRAEWLEWMYGVPDPIRSHEECERYHHRDLQGMTGPELRLDFDRLRHRLMWDERPDAWLLERLDALERMIHEPR